MNDIETARVDRMLTLIYLGTGAAVPGPGRDNTSLVLDDGAEVTLIDASGAPVRRLAEAGIPAARLTRVIITHEHLDHTYGFPSLLQSLWLAGRREALPVYAQAPTWRFLDRLVDAFRPGSWTDAFPIERHVIEPGDRPFLESGAGPMWAAPGKHSVPSVGLRLATAGGAVVYSCDTAPCPAITDLARGARLLLHEATFPAGHEAEANRLGHSSALQAAEVAAAAGVARLALVHYTPAAPGDLEALRAGAVGVFGGTVDVPNDQDRTTVP
jgi:ribonuclease Z